MERVPYVMLPVPVLAAKELCITYGYDQVIVYARRTADEHGAGGEHLTTFGRTDEHSNVAARVGLHLRTAVMGWYGDRWELSRAMVDVIDERVRQQNVEGYKPEHDDTHFRGQMAEAAACYCMSANGYEYLGQDDGDPPKYWPWSDSSWKPKDRYSDLQRAAALIIAEMERLNRAAKKGGA